MGKPRILAFAGSTRRESFNRQLIKIAVAGAEAAGADVTLVELSDYPLPLFNQDLEAEQGLPAAAKELKKLFLAHDGLLMACPEYNSSITPLWKNTIDWVSRQAPSEAPLAAFKGKVATIMSASPGKLGGLRGLVHVRSILGNIGVVVLPNQTAISETHNAFTPDGKLQDPKQQESIEGLGRDLAEYLARMGAGG